MRTYSNATPGKDNVLAGGRVVLYRLKDEFTRAQFTVNMLQAGTGAVSSPGPEELGAAPYHPGQSLRGRVRVFRKVAAGVMDLGLFEVSAFEKAGKEDQPAKFGGVFVRFVRAAVQ